MNYTHFPYQTVIIGQWLEFTIDLPDYRSTDYTLKYVFVGDGQNYEIICTQNADGTFTFAAEVDPQSAAGEYKYQAEAVDASGHKFYVDDGRVISEVNYASLPNGQDNRSHVKKVLDALEAMIEGKATSDQIYYMIEGRALSRIPPNELMDWYRYYKKLYAQEIALERQKHGKANGKHLVRFR